MLQIKNLSKHFGGVKALNGLDLNINEIAKIHGFNNSDESISRLSEMGIIPGSIIRLIKKNTFGGPIQLKLNNYYIAIRKEDAQMINVSNI